MRVITRGSAFWRVKEVMLPPNAALRVPLRTSALDQERQLAFSASFALNILRNLIEQALALL
jgi:hypothetical protein